MADFSELSVGFLEGQKGMNFRLLGLSFSGKGAIKPLWGFI
jgi:hypothetical protein